jgi:hypothetical protein
MLNPIRYYRLRRARRVLATMPPAHAAELLRTLIATNVDLQVDGLIVAAIADRAVEGAEEPVRTVLRRIAEIYRAGRRVHFAWFEATLLKEGETPELLADVESAFAEQGETDD